MDAEDLPGADLVMTHTRGAEAVRSVLQVVTDPEIPVLTIEDLGILRDVQVDEAGRVVVVITPTYSGCPAMSAIREDIESALSAAGWPRVEVRTVHSPAWTTDWMTESGKGKLAAYGIAPPGPTGADSPVLCPRCRSQSTRTVSEFGSTACKALMVCARCGEPFDRFKAI